MKEMLVDLSLAKAMSTYSKVCKKNRYTAIDVLVISYIRSTKECGATNKQLSQLFNVCEKTIQSSINNLCEDGLISKTKSFNKRILKYEERAIEDFIINMNIEYKYRLKKEK